jgi:hypothetical protein
MHNPPLVIDDGIISDSDQQWATFLAINRAAGF